MKRPPAKPLDPRRGLTLLELLAVLMILAITTTVAVVSVQGVVDQSRYETTQRTLKSIEEGAVGRSDQRNPDGGLVVTGFVADIGRLPQAMGSEPESQLAELWENASGLLPFAVRQATPENGVPSALADEDVWVPCGWRGPYLSLRPGARGLHDGWGNDLLLLQIDGATPVEAGDPIAMVRSLGANGIEDTPPSGTADYNRDMTVVLNAFAADVTVTVYERNDAGDLIPPSGSDPASDVVSVRMFGASNGGVGAVLGIDEGDPPAAPPYDAPLVVHFRDVPLGPHVIRAYQGASRKSAPILVPIHPTGSSSYTLILP